MIRRYQSARWMMILMVLFACEGIAFSRSSHLFLSRKGSQQDRLVMDRHMNDDTTTTPTTTTRKAMFDRSSRIKTVSLKLRGGGGGGGNTTVTTTIATVATIFNRFSSYIGQHRSRCLLILAAAIVMESFATGLSKRAKDTGSVATFLMACSVNLVCMIGFNISLAKIDVSVAYALWSAFGTFLVTMVGIVFFNESIDLVKVLCIAMIVLGVTGLNLR